MCLTVFLNFWFSKRIRQFNSWWSIIYIGFSIFVYQFCAFRFVLVTILLKKIKRFRVWRFLANVLKLNIYVCIYFHSHPVMRKCIRKNLTVQILLQKKIRIWVVYVIPKLACPSVEWNSYYSFSEIKLFVEHELNTKIFTVPCFEV